MCFVARENCFADPIRTADPSLNNHWIRSLVNRAFKICNNRHLIFFERETISKMLQQNRYHIKIIRSTICKAIHRNSNHVAKLCYNQQESTKHCVFFKLQLLIVYRYANCKRNSFCIS